MVAHVRLFPVLWHPRPAWPRRRPRRTTWAATLPFPHRDWSAILFPLQKGSGAMADNAVGDSTYCFSVSKASSSFNAFLTSPFWRRWAI